MITATEFSTEYCKAFEKNNPDIHKRLCDNANETAKNSMGYFFLILTENDCEAPEFLEEEVRNYLLCKGYRSFPIQLDKIDTDKEFKMRIEPFNNEEWGTPYHFDMMEEDGE